MAESTKVKVCCLCPQEPKYRCPGCSRRTCSLACCKKHKAKFECDGQRKIAPFVDVRDLKLCDIMDDLRFIEQSTIKIDASRRTLQSLPGSRRTQHKRRHSRKQNRKSQFSIRQKLLIRETKKRSTQLEFMPYGMSKRKQNSSIFLHKDSKIYWHVELIFPCVDEAAPLSVHQRAVCEETSLQHLLSLYLDEQPGNAPTRQKLNRYTKRHDTHRVLLRVLDKRAKTGCVYDEIMPTTTLKDALYRKRVVEYPTFLVVLGADVHQYRLCAQKIERCPTTGPRASSSAPSDLRMVSNGVSPAAQNPPQKRSRISWTPL